MTALTLIAGTYAFCMMSGMVPFLNAELYLLGAAALAPTELTLVLVVAATLGQMTGKMGLYGVGRGVFKSPGARIASWLAKAEAWCREKGGPRKSLIGLSAATGVPPFYLTTLACGITRAPFGSFIALGISGRFVRFATVALIPQLIRQWNG